jgi:signal transduction histidine kinase
MSGETDGPNTISAHRIRTLISTHRSNARDLLIVCGVPFLILVALHAVDICLHMYVPGLFGVHHGIHFDELAITVILCLAGLTWFLVRQKRGIEKSSDHPRVYSLRRSGFRDLLIASFLPALLFAIIVVGDLDLFETFTEFAHRNEAYEIDELPLVFIVALSGFSWLSWRQWRRYETEVERRVKLESEIINTRAIAHEATGNKSAFLANLSHELRTPLNAIIGFSQIIEQEMYGPIGNDKYKEYLGTIHRSATLLDELVGDYLEIEKIETGTDELRFKPCRIPQIFESVLPIVEPAVRSAGVSIIEDFPAALPRLLVDEPAMNKIVINLLTNAIKYNKRGGSVTISADCPSDGPFTLIIEDTGIGIATEDMDKILEPFQRGESPLVKSREGTGLGLNIVKRLIDQHDATITFHSTPNVGTRVAVSFPPERIVRSSLPDHVNTTAAAPISFAI